MATITTDTFLDGGTARTAGEAWSATAGANLTIRTDSRWHANAPASMTGTIGTFDGQYAPFGGGVKIEGRNVRWMPFDTGSGTVPAIGTTITQGGVTGYLLGVWNYLTSAPTAVGTAMPTTGFLKFREVTGGPYAAGALTGISCNATGPDVTGWIEVVRDTGLWSNAGTVPVLTTYGSWFYLDNTTGSAGQQFQIPTNGGGAGTSIAGIQVETAPGSNVYEWFPAVVSSVWTTSILGTDARVKFCQSMGSGLVRLGSNGTNAIGFVPAAGCKVRVPNIFLRAATTGARATNILPNVSAASRPGSPRGGIPQKFAIDKASVEWCLDTDGILTSSFTDSIIESVLKLKNTSGTITVDNVCIGATVLCTQAHLDINISYAQVNVSNTKVVDCTGNRAIQIIYASNVNMTDTIGARVLARSVNFSVHAGSQYNSNINLTRVCALGSAFNIGGTVNMYNCDYVDTLVGNTSSSFATYAVTLYNANNVVIEGFTFGLNGQIANVHPYAGVFTSSLNLGNITIKSIGTYSSPLNSGSNATTYPSYFFEETTGSTNIIKYGSIKIQRCFISALRTNTLKAFSSNYTPLIIEQLISVAPISNTLGVYGTDCTYKGSSLNPTWSTHGGSRRGQFCSDYFRSSTVSGLSFLFYGPDAFSSPYITTSIANPTVAGYSRYDLNLQMGDYFIMETPYFVKGWTSLASASAQMMSGTFTLTYWIDTGSGWSAEKALTSGNLAAETISPTTGFKLKVKGATLTVFSTVATIRSLDVVGVTNSTVQATDLYPLSTATLGFTNLVAGSEVRVYAGSDPATATEIGGTESTGTTYSFTHSSGGTAGVIVIFAMGYQPFYIPYTFKSTDDSILVQQVIDRNYVNPA